MAHREERVLGFKSDTPSYREVRNRERRQDILEAAAQLFRAKGYHAVTIEEIAASLKMTKGSLYHYIHGKEDLLFECHKSAITRLMGVAREVVASGGTPEEKLRQLVVLHVSGLLDDPRMASLILDHVDALPEPVLGIMVADRNEYDALFKQVLREGINQGVFHDDSPTLLTYFLVGAFNYLTTWYRPEGRKTREEIIKFYVESSLRVVMKPKP